MPRLESALPHVTVNRSALFALKTGENDEPFMTVDDWSQPVQFFIGRNGSGKSRAARAIRGAAGGRLLATDRLTGLMSFVNYGWGSIATDYKGVPISESERQQIQQVTSDAGSATDELYALREQPDVWLRVAAFIRRTLGRVIELRESAGFLDPYVRLDDSEYSLLRDEGHGLRELVILLAAAYRTDTALLVIDEPELHLHPSMARLWLTELTRVCTETGKRAIVVTHEPSFVRPLAIENLQAVWLFRAGRLPVRWSDAVLPSQKQRVEATLALNPQLVSQIAFSPRPVLLEGVTDVAAFSTALARLAAPEIVSQTDLVTCGGSGSVGLWLEICTKLDLDVKAIADLDALFDSDVQRTLDSLPGLQQELVAAFAQSPGRLSKVLQPIVQAADAAGVGTNPAQRADWLRMQTDPKSAEVIRRERLLEILRLHGLWLHAGNLEQVLGLTNKGADQARLAALAPSAIDPAALWAAYQLDLKGDVGELLGVAVERVAHAIMEAERAGPSVEFNAPVGASAQADGRLVRVEAIGAGRHRITVLAPDSFAGHWLEFTRETPSTALLLQPPMALESEGDRSADL